LLTTTQQGRGAGSTTAASSREGCTGFRSAFDLPSAAAFGVTGLVVGLAGIDPPGVHHVAISRRYSRTRRERKLPFLPVWAGLLENVGGSRSAGATSQVVARLRADDVGEGLTRTRYQAVVRLAIWRGHL
jgi:hypothetical protein